MVSLRHPAWVWQGAGVQTTARLLPFVLQCSGTRSPDDWSLYSGCIRLTLRHDVWHMRKKVTRPPTKRHLIVRRQKPDQLPARGAPFRVFQVVTRTRDRPVPERLSWTMFVGLGKNIGLEWSWIHDVNVGSICQKKKDACLSSGRHLTRTRWGLKQLRPEKSRSLVLAKS